MAQIETCLGPKVQVSLSVLLRCEIVKLALPDLLGLVYQNYKNRYLKIKQYL